MDWADPSTRGGASKYVNYKIFFSFFSSLLGEQTKNEITQESNQSITNKKKKKKKKDPYTLFGSREHVGERNDCVR
jgi:hypothetical protein